MKTTLLALFCTLFLIAPALADPAGEKQTVQNSVGYSAKGIGAVGASLCSTDLFACANPDHAVFDVSSWSGDGRDITVWANWREGVFGPGDAGGFEMTVCSDRNDNTICSPADDDDYASTYSNQALDSSCSKDDKDCGDNTDAELSMCIREDIGGGFDEVYVFFGSWSDVGLGGNTGTGVSAGTYDVYLDAGSYTSGC